MPQDLPPVGGYEPVQYKVNLSWLWYHLRKNLPANNCSTAQSPGARLPTVILPRRDVCYNGIWMVQDGHWHSGKEVSSVVLYNESASSTLGTFPSPTADPHHSRRRRSPETPSSDQQPDTNAWTVNLLVRRCGQESTSYRFCKRKKTGISSGGTMRIRRAKWSS